MCLAVCTIPLTALFFQWRDMALHTSVAFHDGKWADLTSFTLGQHQELHATQIANRYGKFCNLQPRDVHLIKHKTFHVQNLGMELECRADVWYFNLRVMDGSLGKWFNVSHDLLTLLPKVVYADDIQRAFDRASAA